MGTWRHNNLAQRSAKPELISEMIAMSPCSYGNCTNRTTSNMKAISFFLAECAARQRSGNCFRPLFGMFSFRILAGTPDILPVFVYLLRASNVETLHCSANGFF
jgi:hypothetical protein